MTPKTVLQRGLQGTCALALAAVLAACSSGPEKPKPTPLSPAASVVGTRLIWSAQVGKGPAQAFPLAVGRQVLVAGGDAVVALDADKGQVLWRVAVDRPATGVGSDGQTAAVITESNHLVAMEAGKEIWRTRLPAASFTAPLVAGRRVFVLAADRSVSAYDAGTGARLWTQTRAGEPLVLRQSGVLLAVGDTLVVGLSGRLAGLDPLSGALRWDAPITTARGTNEVERLVDLVAPVSRVGNQVCARAYSAAVGCVDASRGQVLWSKPANGSTGVHGDDDLVVGSEVDGRVRAWKRAQGDEAWSVDRFKFRGLTAPLAVGRVVAFGDSTGLVHLISREDGSDLARLSTDGSAVQGAPVVLGQTLVVQTRNGGVFAWLPQ